MMALRFANGLFEPIWNRNFIDYVQITAAEDLGVGTRAEYYDSSGALRDLVQNHMLQLLALLCMEPPVTFSADDVRDEKVKVLHAIHPPTVEEVPEMAVRAQYGRAWSSGKQVPGYLEEQDVPPDSKTETYAALRLEVDNWRWAGVPIYLRTGKRLARKITEIAVTLKPVPHLAFEQQGSVGVQPNQLIMTMQPNEGVAISLGAKIPGTRMRIRPVNMEFLYGTAFLSQSPEAYERLIIDAMRGDATLFTRDDEVEAQWRIIDPILQAWAEDDVPLPQYPSGSSGPEEANAILAKGTGGGRSEPAKPHFMDGVWHEQDTTPSAHSRRAPGAAQAAPRRGRGRRARRGCSTSWCIADREWRGEILNRLERVGRYHPSRADPLRGRARADDSIDAMATMRVEGDPRARRARALPRGGAGGRRREATSRRWTRSWTRSW